MADSEFWHKLANEFRALPEDATHADMVMKPATEDDPAPTARWRLHSNSHYVAQQFEILARRAGDAVQPDSIFDSFQVWMNDLRSYGINIETRDLHKPSRWGDPTPIIETQVRITDLAKTSAFLCGSKEIRALESERIARSLDARIEREDFLRKRQPDAIHAASIPQPPTDKERMIQERCALIIDFKKRGRDQGVKSITDAMMTQAANPGKWNGRTQIGWWKRGNKGCNRPCDKAIRALLAREPADIWPDKVASK